MSDIDQVTIDNSVWFVKLGVSNNGQVTCFDLGFENFECTCIEFHIFQVVSIGSRDVTVNRTTSTVERSEGIKRPLMDINMTLVEDKVYVKDETVSVMGVMRHMNKSRGEGRTTNIR